MPTDTVNAWSPLCGFKHRHTVLWLSHPYNIALPADLCLNLCKRFGAQFRNVSLPQQKAVGSYTKVLKEFQVLLQFNKKYCINSWPKIKTRKRSFSFIHRFTCQRHSGQLCMYKKFTCELILKGVKVSLEPSELLEHVLLGWFFLFCLIRSKYCREAF